ncbi:MAG TPA: sulfite exporter TauE/SafE family protein, partial [Pararhizobium sp.]|nr:sulfite exporter TauE/SafE family protein [Pararhizobium sp.]
KLIPYFMLGELDISNLEISVSLLPVAVVSTFAGAWLVHHMRPAIFYPFMYLTVFLASLKLIWDGAGHIIGG